MKIVHTADWHLGNTFHGYDRAAEHRAFFDRLLALLQEEQADVLLLSGDVFDTPNPSAAAEELFFRFLDSATRHIEGLQIVITAGNHDSAARLSAPAALLARHGITVVGSPNISPKGEPRYESMLVPLYEKGKSTPKALCLAVPYLRPSDLPTGLTYAEGMKRFMAGITAAARATKEGRTLPLVLMAHFYATGAEILPSDHSERLVVGGQECVDASIIDAGISYAALGHIHKQQKVGGRESVRYSGSALPLSFSEQNYRHGVLTVCIDENGGVLATPRPIEPLRGLMSIPRHGATPLKEVLEAIDKLPRADSSTHPDGTNWPYLEIKLTEPNPDPSMPMQLSEALENKAVHLCRVERVVSGESPTGPPPAFASLERLKRITPLEMAQTIYTRTGGEGSMPPQWTALLSEALENITSQPDDEMP